MTTDGGDACLRTTRGRCDSLRLHRSGLAPPTPCRPPGAPKKTVCLTRRAELRGTASAGQLSVFAELQPHIGTAATCAAVPINRSGVYRARVRWARRNVCMLPRPRRQPPPLAFSDAERVALLLILNSERFADLPPTAVFAILLDEGRYHGSIRTMRAPSSGISDGFSDALVSLSISFVHPASRAHSPRSPPLWCTCLLRPSKNSRMRNCATCSAGSPPCCVDIGPKSPT